MNIDEKIAHKWYDHFSKKGLIFSLWDKMRSDLLKEVPKGYLFTH